MRPVLSVGLAVLLLGAAAGLVRAGGDQAEIKAILDRAVKAAGGRQKLQKLRAVTWKGKADFEVGDQQLGLTYEASARGWDRYRVEMQIQAGGNSVPIVVVLNGDKAWASPNGKTREAKGEEFALVRDFLYGLRVPQMLPALAKEKEFKLSHLGEVKVGEREAVGLSVSRTGLPDVGLFFDKKGGLPLKSAVRLKLPGGQEKEVEFLFGDYKDFDGLRQAGKITVRLDGQEYVTELTELQAQDGLDDSLFERP